MSREEIKRGIIEITKSRPMAYQLIKYLHSEGVAIKGEGKLPRLRDYDKSGDFQDGFILAKVAMLLAGYTAWEDLA